jgi:hypothetical protein
VTSASSRGSIAAGIAESQGRLTSRAKENSGISRSAVTREELQDLLSGVAFTRAFRFVVESLGDGECALLVPIQALQKGARARLSLIEGSFPESVFRGSAASLSAKVRHRTAAEPRKLLSSLR